MLANPAFTVHRKTERPRFVIEIAMICFMMKRMTLLTNDWKRKCRQIGSVRTKKRALAAKTKENMNHKPNPNLVANEIVGKMRQAHPVNPGKLILHIIGTPAKPATKETIEA